MSTFPDFVQSFSLKYDGKDYRVLNLAPDSIPDDDIENRIYRSAIFTADQQQLLCVAPSKSVPTLRESKSSFEITEIVEGTMINLFWNGDKWEIATKKRIGGDNFFFRNTYGGVEGELPNKTFRRMFLDALDVPDLSSLDFDRSFCYSFVLQHPCNHIVQPILTPQLYLVSTYELKGTSCDYLNPRSHPEYDRFVARNIKVPMSYDFYLKARPLTRDCFVSSPNRFGYEYLKQLDFEAIMSNPENSPFIPGVMITDLETGLLRTKFHNQRYLDLKELRGNNPNLHYQYITLRKTPQRVAQFLHFFPMYEKHFARFADHFEEFKQEIRKVYWEVYVKKTRAKDSVEGPVKFFVHKLHHEVFLPRHKENKKFFITADEIGRFLDRENMMIPF